MKDRNILKEICKEEAVKRTGLPVEAPLVKIIAQDLYTNVKSWVNEQRVFY